MPKRKHQEAEPSNAPSLSNLSTAEALRSLQNSIVGAKASATFVCGGKILLKKESDSSTNPEGASLGKNPPSRKAQQPSSVHIFWAKEDDTPAQKLVLPLSPSSTIDSSTARLDQLVAYCEPATFGLGKEDVLDLSYRKAGKLDSDKFLCSIHPADYEIIENIEKVLLPGFNSTDQNALPFRKLAAELYKLNIYSGPSGIFKRHVDTPRCESQIGSLVICLPSQFKRGDLMVQHDEKEVLFNWEGQSRNTIQWASFYSDCEHEIQQVTEGHRITLTYNLYVTEPIAHSITSSGLDVRTLPLYSFLRDLLAKPGFMREGGTLGIWCSHSYPHTIKQGLKGSDVVLYAVLTSLDIDTKVLPAVVFHKAIEKEKYPGVKPDDPEEVEKENVFWDSIEREKEGGISEDQPFDEFKVQKYPDEGLYSFREYSTKEEAVVHVGDALKAHTLDIQEVDENYKQKLERLYGGKIVEDFTWVAGPRHRQAVHTYLAWGNQSQTDVLYSYATIVAHIPPSTNRLERQKA